MTERPVLSVEQYSALLMEVVGPLADTVQCPPTPGLILAEPVRSQGDIPAFDNSAMDGYALRWPEDDPPLPLRLRVVADVAAGSALDPPLGKCECARIMTGAPVPSAADTVVPVEQTNATEVGSLLSVNELPSQGRGAHIRRAGEDTAAGQVVLAAGTHLTSAGVAAACAAGVGTVAVRRAPVVSVLATGDELVTPWAEKLLQRGQIYESNTAYLAAAASGLGAQVRCFGPLPDQVEPFREGLRQAAEGVDLVVLTGGVSVGAYDVVRQGLAERAQFVNVRIQPGKPQGFAPPPTPGAAPIVCLPGNPVSVAVSFTVFVAPMLRRLQGLPEPQPTFARVEQGWKSPAGKQQFLPAHSWVGPDAVRRVQPAHAGGSASHLVTSLATADCLAQVDEQVTQVHPADVLPVWSLP